MSGKKLGKAVKEVLEELVAAAACYGAVMHPEYRDDRKTLLQHQALARLKRAATSYHTVVVERTIPRT